MVLQEDLRAHLSCFVSSDTLLFMQLLFTEMASLWLVAPLDRGGFGLDRTSLTAAAVVSGMVYITLRYATLHYTTLHCTTLHCTILYYIAC